MNIRNWNELVDAVLLRKISFLVTFFVIFLLSYAFFAWLDLLPEPVSTEKAESVTETVVNESSPENAESVISSSTELESEASKEIEPLLPDTIIIDSLDRTITVLNPTSTKVEDLDAALLYGVVRHPDSATLERDGSVFILGHSSYLPTVLNRNFQAFNGIQNLKFGDTIRLQSNDQEYVYRVDKVYRTKAQDATVPIAGVKQRLILATCNSFGSIDDRYIVEADLLEVRVI
ncbi:MAG: sortase [Candidatus Paceibacterota bacterium]